MTNLVITAYCACKLCCGDFADGITASGEKPVQGVTVAAPRSIPFGTRIHIAGVGWRTVQDRTSRKYDGRIDVYFSKHADAMKFGIRRAQVVLWSQPNEKTGKFKTTAGTDLHRGIQTDGALVADHAIQKGDPLHQAGALDLLRPGRSLRSPGEKADRASE